MDVPGNGFPRISVGSGTVFVSSGDRVLAVDADSGEEVWSRTLDSRVYSVPSIVEGTVYVGTEGTVRALSASDGSTEWTFSTADAEGVGSNQGVWAPAVANGTVAITSLDLHAYLLELE
ncbi:MAG: PQQ-binding-like beta-propeller repeat protein [Halobacteriales archaeon]